MSIAGCRIPLISVISTASVSAPKNTHYNKIAAMVLEMARAYECDGSRFLGSGDPVNALASYYYAFGWLHFGGSSGLLTITHSALCPFTENLETLKGPSRIQLEEKTSRYAHLLDSARSQVRCAPDPATTSYDFAERILCISGIYASRGKELVQSGKLEDALASFCYGHGWLDACVTCGFFQIAAERDLFTV